MLIDDAVLSAWSAPSEDDPDTTGPAGVIVELILLSLATIVVGMRLCARRALSHSLGLDGIFIGVAYVHAASYAIVSVIGHYNFGWDRHTWDTVPTQTVPRSLEVLLVQQLLFDVATSFTKLSILIVVCRLAVAKHSRMRWAAIIIAHIIALNMLLFLFISIFQCWPIAETWTLSTTAQHCINQSLHATIATAINTLLNFVVVLLPIRLVKNLGLPRKQEILVFALFAGGLVTSIAGLVRTYYTVIFLYSPSTDITWHAHEVAMTGVIELSLGLIFASAPDAMPFFSIYLPRLFPPTPEPRVIHVVPNSQQYMSRASLFSTRSGSIYIMNDISEINQLPGSFAPASFALGDDEKRLEEQDPTCGPQLYVHTPLPSYSNQPKPTRDVPRDSQQACYILPATTYQTPETTPPLPVHDPRRAGGIWR